MGECNVCTLRALWDLQTRASRTRCGAQISVLGSCGRGGFYPSTCCYPNVLMPGSTRTFPHLPATAGRAGLCFPENSLPSFAAACASSGPVPGPRGGEWCNLGPARAGGRAACLPQSLQGARRAAEDKSASPCLRQSVFGVFLVAPRCPCLGWPSATASADNNLSCQCWHS